MKEKQCWNFGCRNKKAFIFTMDVAVALVIVFSLLFTANFFVVRKFQDPYPNLQMIRVGSDFLHIMNYNGLFNTPDSLTISAYLSQNLPVQYQMRIESTGPGQCNFQAGPDVPDKKTIVSGKEYIIGGGNYCSVRYKLWLK